MEERDKSVKREERNCNLKQTGNFVTLRLYVDFIE